MDVIFFKFDLGVLIETVMIQILMIHFNGPKILSVTSDDILTDSCRQVPINALDVSSNDCGVDIPSKLFFQASARRSDETRCLDTTISGEYFSKGTINYLCLFDDVHVHGCGNIASFQGGKFHGLNYKAHLKDFITGSDYDYDVPLCCVDQNVFSDSKIHHYEKNFNQDGAKCDSLCCRSEPGYIV